MCLRAAQSSGWKPTLPLDTTETEASGWEATMGITHQREKTRSSEALAAFLDQNFKKIFHSHLLFHMLVVCIFALSRFILGAFLSASLPSRLHHLSRSLPPSSTSPLPSTLSLCPLQLDEQRLCTAQADLPLDITAACGGHTPGSQDAALPC